VNVKKIESSTQRSAKIISANGSFSVPTACYIYGIAELGKAIVLKSRAIDSPLSKVYTIPYKDICAIISRTKYEEYDPSDENILAHNDVLKEVHSEFDCTILPLRFSTIAKSETDVGRILVRGYPKFKQKLQALKGKAEIALKVYCIIDRFRDSIRSEGKITDQKAIDDEMRKRTVILANKLLDRLGPVSIDHVLNDLVFNDLILNAAFLVDERRAAELVSIITDFERENKRNLKLEWSGPYVPYSFTEPPS
jgi:hypothetical protein